MVRMYRGAGHEIPDDPVACGRWLDDVRQASCPHAVPSEVYLSQMTSILGQEGDPSVAKVGWRRTIRHESEIRATPVIVCGGSGAMKYPHAGRGRSIVDLMKGFGGWSNMTSFIYAGAKVNDWL